MKVVALKTISNISTLIRDLFHNPPSYKSNISLSWKPLPSTLPAAAQKRALVSRILYFMDFLDKICPEI